MSDLPQFLSLTHLSLLVGKSHQQTMSTSPFVVFFHQHVHFLNILLMGLFHHVIWDFSRVCMHQFLLSNILVYNGGFSNFKLSLLVQNSTCVEQRTCEANPAG